MEYFINQNDIETKTKNFCNKLEKNGLLNTDQFNQCISTFNDASSGLLPKEIKNPNTGVKRNYSLYNTQHDITAKINSNNSDSNTSITNTIMLSTNTGQTLACKSDNTIYLVSNINDSSVKQNELYFTLVPQDNNNESLVYALLSPYSKYLIVKEDKRVSYSGTSIGPFSLWNIIKISSTGTSDNNNIMLESSQNKNFHLVINNDNNNNNDNNDNGNGNDNIQELNITYGKSDNMIWTMINKTETDPENDENNMLSIKYNMQADEILQKINNTEIHKICINELLNTYTNISIKINNIYIKVINYIKQYLSKQQTTYLLSNYDYKTKIASIKTNNMLSNISKNNIINNIPLPSGAQMSINDINSVIQNITDSKNVLINNLQKNILSLKTKLNSFSDASGDYNKFIETLTIENETIDNNIKQNKSIIDRQTQSVNNINNKYIKNITKQKKLEDTEAITNVNSNLLDNFNKQIAYKKKIYMVSICILILFLIFISYKTINKIKKNI